MVVANSDRLQNVNYCPTKNNNNLNSNVDSNKMSAKGILICRDNSHGFNDRTLNLDQAVKIGRSVARIRAAADNAIFDCKVLSRNHALLWYDAGKFYLRDTGSSNGTFVNNQRLGVNGSESACKEVCSGDIVQFGVDVVESPKKVTHGCIIATLKLFLPDGKEAKGSMSRYRTIPACDVTLEDLYKLNQYVQEANRREKNLHSKLVCLQNLVENTRKAASQSWKAFIDEDRLLSRVRTVENQFFVCTKNFSEVKIRDELMKFEKEKSQYQIAAKNALERVHQEKLEVSKNSMQVESRLNESEKECQSLHEMSKHTQLELELLASKYAAAQKNLAEFEEKLAKEEQKSSKIIKEAKESEREMQELLLKKLNLEFELDQKNSGLMVNAYNLHGELQCLKRYSQKLQDINTKLLPDEFTGSNNPIESINAMSDIVEDMLKTNEYDDEIKQRKNVDNLENILETKDNQSESHNIDSNQEVGRSERSSYDKNVLDDTINDCDNLSAYILPPSNSRLTIINGKINLDEHKENCDLNTDNNDDTSSVISDTDTNTFVNDSDDLTEKSIIENNLITNTGTNSFVNTEINDNYDGKLLDNVNDLQSQSQYYNFIDINNRTADGDDSSDSADSPNESMSIVLPKIKNNDEIAMVENKNFHVNDQCENNENLLDDVSIKLNVDDLMDKVKHVVEESHDRNNIEINDNDSNIDNGNTDNEEKNENYELKEDGRYVKTLKPILKNCDNHSQYSNANDYILHLFVNSLESLKADDNDDVESQQVVNKELDQLRNWFVNQPNDVVIEKLKEFYYRSKNDNTRVQEMSEELVILKEKYSSCYDEKTDIWRKYLMFKTQCGSSVVNASYSVPIQYFVPVAIAFLWMLFEQLF